MAILRKIQLLSILLIFVLSLSAFGQNNIEYWPDGKTIKEAGNIVNGQKDGIWKFYNANGRLQMEKKLVKGSLEYTKWYDESGVLTRDKFEFLSLVNTYYPSGERHWLFSENELGERTGDGCVEYYKNGHKKAKGTYNKGSKVGAWAAFREDGSLLSFGEVNVNGDRKGKWTYYYDINQKSAEGYFDKDGWAIPGTWRTYDSNGKYDEMNTPPPSVRQFDNLQDEIINKVALAKPKKGLTLACQQTFLRLAAVDTDEDDKKTITEKVQHFWKGYRKYLVGSADYAVKKKNIMKLSMDASNFVFVKDALNTYKLDMNFIDPSDNKTFMDYIEEQEYNLRKSSKPINDSGAKLLKELYGVSDSGFGKYAMESLAQQEKEKVLALKKADEFKKIYQLAKSNGAKHSKEL